MRRPIIYIYSGFSVRSISPLLSLGFWNKSNQPMDISTFEISEFKRRNESSASVSLNASQRRPHYKPKGWIEFFEVSANQKSQQVGVYWSLIS